MKLPEGVRREEDTALVPIGGGGGLSGSLTKRLISESGGLAVIPGGEGTAMQAFRVMSAGDEPTPEIKGVVALVRAETAHSGSKLHLEDVQISADNGAIEVTVPEKVKLGKVHDVVIVGVDTSASTAYEAEGLANAAVALSAGVKKEITLQRDAHEAATGIKYEAREMQIAFMGYGGDGVQISQDSSAVDRHHYQTSDWFSTVAHGLHDSIPYFQKDDLGVGIVITIDDMPSDPASTRLLANTALQLNKLGVVVVTLQTTGGNTYGYGGWERVANELESQLRNFDRHLLVDSSIAGDLKDPSNIQELVARIVKQIIVVQEEVAEEVKAGQIADGKAARVRFNAKIKEEFHKGPKASATSSLGSKATLLAGKGDDNKTIEGGGDKKQRRLSFSGVGSTKGFLSK